MSWVTPEKFAAQVILNVCELPDYNSPDDQPDLLQCTVRQLEACILSAFEYFDENGGSEKTEGHVSAVVERIKLRDRVTALESAMRRICDSKDVPWTAAAMFHIAEAALRGSTPTSTGKAP